MSLRALILDYGEVVCHRPAPERLQRMAAALGLDRETFVSRYQDQRGIYDRGDLRPEEYWSAVAAKKVDDGLLRNLREWDVEMWSDVNRDMIEWLEKVRAAGMKTALLSNMHEDMAVHVRRTFEWLKHMDCLTLSCELHVVKPEPAIYRRCIDCLGVQPSEAVFIDDREVNITAASETGLRAVRFESIQRLRRDLAGFGFPVLPNGRTA